MKIIGKSSGGSAIAASAYRSGSVLIEQVYNKESGTIDEIVHNYQKKSGVVFSRIFAQSGLSYWCFDRQELWNRVTKAENRKDARFAREIDIGLQKEFDLEQNIEVISEFIKDNFVSRGMIVDANIHYDNPDNPHVHLMLTTRELLADKDGMSYFGKKVTAWNDKSWLLHLRKNWADINNKYFKIYDIDKSITHESYAARGINISSTIHEGDSKHGPPPREKLEHNKNIISDNIEFIKHNPLAIIASITNSKSIFTSDDIKKELGNFLNDIAKRSDATIEFKVESNFDELFAEIKKDLVKICDNDLRGRELYTSRHQLELEKSFLTNLQELKNRAHHVLNINSVVGDQLTSEQQKAVIELANSGDAALLIGRPGTGKSFVTKSLVAEYRAQGYRVIGAAYSASAAQNLGITAGITSHTLSKWQYDWNLHKENEDNKGLLSKLTSRDIFIIDEMSMVDLKMIDYILHEVKTSGAKVIFIGDDNQFNAITLGGASDKLVENLPNIELNEIFRQKALIDREVTSDLADYKVDDAILKLKSQNKFIFKDNPAEVREQIISDYIDLIQNNNAGTAIITHSNDKVNSLNQELRVRLIDNGMLQTSHLDTGGKIIAGKPIAIGESIIFTKNNRRLGLNNGDHAIVTKIRANNFIDVKFTNKDKEITLNTNKYSHFDYGYAITGYKSQGQTYDNSLILIDEHVGYEAFNVMATRHRYISKIYVEENVLNQIIARKNNVNSSIASQRDAALFELLVRRDYASFASDYQNFDEIHQVKNIRKYIDARDKAANLYKEMLMWKDEHEYNNIKDHESWGEFIKHKEIRCEIAKTIIHEFKNYRKYIAGSNINYGTLLKHAGLDKIKFVYETSKIIEQDQDLKSKYQELIESLTDKPTKSLIEQANNLIEDSNNKIEQHELLKSELNKLKEEKWQATSNIKANENIKTDLKYYLQKLYKDEPGQVIAKYEQLKDKTIIEKNPEILGELVGFGIGRYIGLDNKRAEAIYRLGSLDVRLAAYDCTKENIAEYQKQLAKIAKQEFDIAKKSDEIEKTYLSPKQTIKLLDIIQGHNGKQEQSKTHSLSNSRTKPNNLSIDEIHDLLASKIPTLVPELMEKITGKKSEIQGDYIKSGSIYLNTEGTNAGLWYRFSTGKGGNLFDLINEAFGLADIKAAIVKAREYLGEDYHHQLRTEVIEAKEKISQNDNIKPILPAPASAKAFDPKQDLYYKFRNNHNILEDVYEYRNINNQLCGYVVRIKNISTNEKELIPVTYTESSEHQGWRAKGFGDNRTLYNEHMINSDKPILIVEGEKTANAASKLYPEFTVITWNGGANAYHKTNWQPLQDKEIIIWPDNDKAGIDAAKNIKDILTNIGAKSTHIIDLTKLHLPAKWDLADKLPDNLHNYEVTNLLFAKASLNKSIKIARIADEYIRVRKSIFEDELKSCNNFAEYLIQKDKNNELLKIEHDLVTKSLQINTNLTDTVRMGIYRDARKLCEDHYNPSKTLTENLLKHHPAASEDDLRKAIESSNILITKHSLAGDNKKQLLTFSLAKSILKNQGSIQNIQLEMQKFNQQKQLHMQKQLEI